MYIFGPLLISASPRLISRSSLEIPDVERREQRSCFLIFIIIWMLSQTKFRITVARFPQRNWLIKYASRLCELTSHLLSALMSCRKGSVRPRPLSTSIIFTFIGRALILFQEWCERANFLLVSPRGARKLQVLHQEILRQWIESWKKLAESSGQARTYC